MSRAWFNGGSSSVRQNVTGAVAMRIAPWSYQLCMCSASQCCRRWRDGFPVDFSGWIHGVADGVNFLLFPVMEKNVLTWVSCGVDTNSCSVFTSLLSDK